MSTYCRCPGPRCIRIRLPWKENVAFREKYRKQIEAQAKKRKAEEMI